MINNLFKLRDHNRVAITGIAGGGKTVFLTSLLSHLSEFGQSGFYLSRGVDIRDFRRVEPRSSWPPSFNHANFREDLANGRWPEKTTDCSQYVCQFKRSDWKFYTQKMSFFDFPGERVADAAIAGFNDYGEWSDHILTHFKQHHGYARAAGEYLSYLQQEEISEQKLIGFYKQTLARLILDFKPLISPSVFLLDKKGVPASHGSVAEIAESRLVGISEVEQFAPLPSNLRKKYSRLSKKMAKFYRKYRNDVAMPVLGNIARAESLIVLVDIPSLLAGGVGRYNDNRQILLDLFESLRPRSDIGAMLMKYFTFWQKSLSRIAFVAGKADMVHPLDVENKRMVNLLKMMTDRAARMLPDVKSEWFVCSACHSTFPLEGMRRLKGKIAYNNPEKEFREYNVPELPEAWPENWNAGDYPFYKVYPDAPRNYLIPPRHSGLDRVFEFIS